MQAKPFIKVVVFAIAINENSDWLYRVKTKLKSVCDKIIRFEIIDNFTTKLLENKYNILLSKTQILNVSTYLINTRLCVHIDIIYYVIYQHHREV